ncbi:MAG: hypothetical protein ACTSQY_05965 [Candidatus Odinarchaeia archaeon]
MNSEKGEIKAGIVITSLLKFFSELFVSRMKTREGEIKYQVDGPEGTLCKFRVVGDKVIFLPESTFGGKEDDVKNLIEKRVSNVQFTPAIVEKPIATKEISEPAPVENSSTVEPTEVSRPVIPNAPGLIDNIDRTEIKTIECEGRTYELKTTQVPIPSTSYMVALGTAQNNWVVVVTRGRKVIGVERIPSLDPNVINGAIQKIIVIPLFSPYAVSRSVQKLINQVNQG